MLARHEFLDQLADVRKENLKLLRTMHDVGLKWAEKYLSEDKTLIFRLGYHSVCVLLLQLVCLFSAWDIIRFGVVSIQIMLES